VTAVPNHLVETTRVLGGRYAAVNHGLITTGFVNGDPIPIIPNTIAFEHAWTTIDLGDGPHWLGNDPHLPDVTAIKAVRIYSMIAVTADDGNPDGNARQLLVGWRAAEDDPLTLADAQMSCLVASGGLRQQASTLVPVRSGRIQTFWSRRYNTNPALAIFSAGHTTRIGEVYY
jgi:hypothetical protein